LALSTILIWLVSLHFRLRSSKTRMPLSQYGKGLRWGDRGNRAYRRRDL